MATDTPITDKIQQGDIANAFAALQDFERALTAIDGMEWENNEWDAVEKYAQAKETARKVITQWKAHFIIPSQEE